MIDDFLSEDDKLDLAVIIEDNLVDVLSYHYINKARHKIRKLLNMPFRVGEYYNSHGKDDDVIRRAIDIRQTKKKKKLVKHYQDENKITNERPKKCDMITSAPCTWSKTHWSSERCVKCGHVFPEWN